MSVEAMTWVFRYSESKLASRLVALAMADYAHDDGSHVFASVPTLARKAKVSKRSASYAIRDLEKLGEIEQTGLHDSGTKIYRFRFEKVAQPHLFGAGEGADIAGGADSAGVQDSARRGAGSAPKPSVNPSTTSRPSDSTHRESEIDDKSVDRPEVIRLCNLLADTVAEDGSPRPNAQTKAWQRDCRLLLDKDMDQRESLDLRVRPVEYVIRWCHQPGQFWAQNILSMPKLRKQWPRLVKEIKNEQARRQRTGDGQREDRQAQRLRAMTGGA